MMVLPVLVIASEMYFKYQWWEIIEEDASKQASGVFHEVIINNKTVASFGN